MIYIDKYSISYYCFLKNDESYDSYGASAQSAEEKQQESENLGLKSATVLKVFNENLENENLPEKIFKII